MTRPRGPLAALLLAVTVVLGLAPAAPAQALASGVTQAITYNDPTAGETGAYRLHREQVALINGTPAGEAITFGTWRIDDGGPLDAEVGYALRKAHNRGVVVTFIYNGGKSVTDGEAALLRDKLGSRFVRCKGPDGEEGCLAAANNSSMHAKYMTISRTVVGGVTREKVVSVGTFNPTSSMAGIRNTHLVTTGDSCHYDQFVRFAADQKAANADPAKRTSNYQGTTNGRKACSGSATETFLSPSSSDTWVALLRRYDGRVGCTVKIDMSEVDSSRVKAFAAELGSLRRQGASIELNTRVRTTYAVEQLKLNGITWRVGRPISHQKDAHVEGCRKASDGTIAPATGWTGGHNLNRQSIIGDDVLVKLGDPNVVAKMETEHDRWWKTAVPTTGTT